MEPKFDYQELALQLQLAGLLDDKSVVGAADNADVLKALIDGKIAEHALTVSEDGKSFTNLKEQDEGDTGAGEAGAKGDAGDDAGTAEDIRGIPGEGDVSGDTDAKSAPADDVFTPIPPVQDIGENGKTVAKTSEAPDGDAPAPVSPTEQAADIDVIAATTVTQAPAVTQEGVQDNSGAAPAEEGVTSVGAQVFSEKNVAGKVVHARLLEYIHAMNVKKPISDRDGARWQGVLYRQIINTINRPDNFFDENFTSVLNLFREHAKGVFGPTAVTRFMDEVELTPEDRQAFQCLVHLIAMVADPRSRQQALKQIDLNMALSSGVTEQGRQRVADYLGVRV